MVGVRFVLTLLVYPTINQNLTNTIRRVGLPHTYLNQYSRFEIETIFNTLVNVLVLGKKYPNIGIHTKDIAKYQCLFERQYKSPTPVFGYFLPRAGSTKVQSKCGPRSPPACVPSESLHPDAEFHGISTQKLEECLA